MYTNNEAILVPIGMNKKDPLRHFPKRPDMKGKDGRIRKKEQAMESHVKYSAFTKTIANALCFK